MDDLIQLFLSNEPLPEPLSLEEFTESTNSLLVRATNEQKEGLLRLQELYKEMDSDIDMNPG